MKHIKTTTKIEKALLTLLQTNDINQITTKQIAQTADINRVTDRKSTRLNSSHAT